LFGKQLSLPRMPHLRTPAPAWNERGARASASRGSQPKGSQKDRAMMAFQIIGGIFVLLFLAAAMTGIEGAHGSE
jgi:hypothetical protein